MVEDALTEGGFVVFSEMRRYLMFGFNVPDDFAERLIITLTFLMGNLLVKLLYTFKIVLCLANIFTFRYFRYPNRSPIL